MAIIDKPDLYFNTLLYTGNGSASRAITGVGFQPDLMWFKVRNSTGTHAAFDSVRGTTGSVYRRLLPNETNAEDTASGTVLAIGSDGFTLGNDANINENTETYVSWNWKANGSGSLNEVGSIDSTVSVNTTSGFSIVSYTGNGTAGATIGHGLGAVPKMFIVKRVNATGGWVVYNEAIGNTKIIELHDSGASQTSSAAWNNTSPSSTTFTLGDYTSTNTSGGTYIAYCFAEKQGYSKFGSYTGNSNADGTFVYTGFKPAFILTKASSTGQSWQLYDNKRNAVNQSAKILFPNLGAAEQDDSSAAAIDILSNGFKQRVNDVGGNGSGNTYIYMAFAESPFVTSTGVPATAR
jgi:hypothetical protein